MAEVAKLPLETMNKVLNLLGTLPYGQVAEIIQEVRQNAQVTNEGDDVVDQDALKNAIDQEAKPKS
jgi:hypothetical protein